MWLELKLNTSYATLSSGIPWNIPLATSILWVNKGAIRQVHTVSQLITSPKKLFACCQFTQPISLFAWTDSTKKDVLNSVTKLNEQKRQHCGHYETKYYYTKQVYILFFNPFDHRVKSRGKPTYSPGELTSGKLAFIQNNCNWWVLYQENTSDKWYCPCG